MVAMVATALSADRALAAAPQLRAHRAQMSDAARKLAVRLLVVFRRSMGSARLQAVQRFTRIPRLQPLRLATLIQRILGYPTEFTPFQYRLPPPTL